MRLVKPCAKPGEAAALSFSGEGLHSFPRTLIHDPVASNLLFRVKLRGYRQNNSFHGSGSNNQGTWAVNLLSQHWSDPTAKGKRGPGRAALRPSPLNTPACGRHRRAAHGLRRPVCSSLPPSLVPSPEQTQRKLATLRLGFHSCPRLTLQPHLPGKLIKRTINPHKNPKPTPKLKSSAS